MGSLTVSYILAEENWRMSLAKDTKLLVLKTISKCISILTAFKKIF